MSSSASDLAPLHRPSSSSTRTRLAAAATAHPWITLNSRVTIEQAKGALARMRDVSVDEAFTLMRDHSRRQHLRLTDLALAVVTDPASHPDLTGTHRR